MVRRLREVREELRSLRRDARELARRVDLLSFQTQEIRSANLRPGEEEELRRERNLLANAEKLMRLATDVYEAVSGGEEGRGAGLRALARRLAWGGGRRTWPLWPSWMTPWRSRTRRWKMSCTRWRNWPARCATIATGSITIPQRLQAIEDRVDLVQSLKRKYGDSIDEVLSFADRAQEELDALSHSEERTEVLEAEEKALLAEIGRAGAALSRRVGRPASGCGAL